MKFDDEDYKVSGQEWERWTIDSGDCQTGDTQKGLDEPFDADLEAILFFSICILLNL